MTPPSADPRLEAFCDGVFAIALTLLVIDIKVPATAQIEDAATLRLALRHLLPVIGAFVLSFTIILITWVNHHATLKLVTATSPTFLYANGFLLLTVVFVPFPTALLGAYVFTAAAGPAVALYDAVLAVQAVSWILLLTVALQEGLARDSVAAAQLGANRRYGYLALGLYSLLALAALRFPLAVAAATVVIWAFWLGLGVTMHTE